ncbi:DUF4129 domain-containing protein [Mycobacterium decipiens]|uniref:Protein-glutamine gamma-glutamyltransferase-like C-terminal domain-containing protein n=1 Tax=Mycobacterium decipiens TaxID=1430326 RepID=A0A1X2M0M8_9MYCO|nr:DUF4129 domain-containing protein [Mycobacterium decipiens]OSC43178.1 hypothetical protein B8W66_02005 [Mycobacterium decipiens]
MSDNPTRRVVIVIVLVMLAAAGLRGYLPADDGAPLAEAGGSRAVLMFIVAALSATLALVAVAIITRLRDPRTVAPSAGDLSPMLGGERGRPNWRVVLIGLGVILAWLLIATLLARLFVPHDVNPAVLTPDSSAPSDADATAEPRPQPPQSDTGDVFGILFASTILFLAIVVGAMIVSRMRRRSAPAAFSDDLIESVSPPAGSESLARAAEIGLAEMADPSRDPREAIIACYAAMERELANVPGAVPQACDTPTEVLARAVEHRALHADNAAALVNLFAEARFSPHVMNEEHRESAARLLRLVLDELSSRTAI